MSNDWYKVAPDQHFWCRHRNEQLRRLLRRFARGQDEVLEVGCGHGVVLRYISQQLGMCVDGLELNAAAVNHIGLTDCRNLYVLDILKDASKLELRYDVIVIFDVLEHITDDEAFLKAALQFAKSGGLVLINVPAGEWLRSRYDDEDGHLRRYSKGMLKSLMDKAGLELLSVQFWGMTYVPLLIIRKFWLKFAKSTNAVKEGFDEGTGLKRFLLNQLGSLDCLLPWKPFGTSLILAARKL